MAPLLHCPLGHRRVPIALWAGTGDGQIDEPRRSRRTCNATARLVGWRTVLPQCPKIGETRKRSALTSPGQIYSMIKLASGTGFNVGEDAIGKITFAQRGMNECLVSDKKMNLVQVRRAPCSAFGYLLFICRSKSKLLIVCVLLVLSPIYGILDTKVWCCMQGTSAVVTQEERPTEEFVWAWCADFFFFSTRRCDRALVNTRGVTAIYNRYIHTDDTAIYNRYFIVRQTGSDFVCVAPGEIV